MWRLRSSFDGLYLFKSWRHSAFGIAYAGYTGLTAATFAVDPGREGVGFTDPTFAAAPGAIGVHRT